MPALLVSMWSSVWSPSTDATEAVMPSVPVSFPNSPLASQWVLAPTFRSQLLAWRPANPIGPGALRSSDSGGVCSNALDDDGLALRLPARPKQGSGGATRDLTQNLGRLDPAGLGLGVEDVGADRQPGEDPARGCQPRAADHRNPEAVGHARRVVEGITRQPGDQWQQGNGEQARDPRHGVV